LNPRNSIPAILSVLAALALLSGCTGGQTPVSYAAVTGGTPKQGRAIIQEYNCGSCHIIPGIRDANGLVGPPLILFGRRTFIAGELPNNTANLVQWIRNPQSIEPKNAMPNLGLSDEQARSVAAYLYTLR
jgi:cytochrome c